MRSSVDGGLMSRSNHGCVVGSARPARHTPGRRLPNVPHDMARSYRKGWRPSSKGPDGQHAVDRAEKYPIGRNLRHARFRYRNSPVKNGLFSKMTGSILMIETVLVAPMFAAAGYSLLYLLLGGGFGGAVLIFI